MQLQISNIMNVFEVLKSFEKSEDRNESCHWLKGSLRMSHHLRQTCMDDDDEPDGGMDSSDSRVMARRLHKTHTMEMAGFGEILCSLPFRGKSMARKLLLVLFIQFE
ncbi:hypothetical protein ElyMa_005152500 [Elysia marginata]|uniref:Uncharacterized protein n=1 Tax=Elysia marginata TaxID=1093978 RepID=A0AAV4JNE6_9GAST|nr:hypothetical protein ElyMa_005152500 [Elysia marginata]